jgi:hypothetical protein
LIDLHPFLRHNATTRANCGGQAGDRGKLAQRDFFTATVALLLIGLTVAFPGVSRAAAEASPATASALEKIGRTYDLRIVTATHDFPVRPSLPKIACQSADGELLDAYVRLFAEEFTLYPPELMVRARLKRVVLCAALSYDGQPRAAIPDYAHDTYYLDICRIRRGISGQPYLRTVLHHDLFHFLDYRDDGKLYADDRWDALQPKGFRYGTGGINAQKVKGTGSLTDRTTGFLTHYATTGVEEDKAEVFTYLVVDPEYVEDRARKDPVVKAKAARIKEILRAFCPSMNDAFWDRVRARAKK